MVSEASSVARVTPEVRPTGVLSSRVVVPVIHEENTLVELQVEVSLASCALLLPGDELEVRVCGYAPSPTPLFSIQAFSTAHCRFTSADEPLLGSKITSISFLEALFNDETAARCNIVVSRNKVIDGRPSGGGTLEFEGYFIAVSKRSSILLFSPPNQALDSSLPSRLCATPTFFTASSPDVSSTDSQNMSTQVGQSSVTTSIGQKNLRRQRTNTNNSMSSSPSCGSGTSQGIATIPNSCLAGSNTNVGSAGGTGSSSISPITWVKENATCIGNSPLTSPLRPPNTSAGVSKSTFAVVPYNLLPPSAPELTKSVSCPTLTSPNFDSKHLSDLPSKPPNKNMDSCDTLYLHSPNIDQGRYDCLSSSTFTSLSPCDDSGSRSIFPELVLEEGNNEVKAMLQPLTHNEGDDICFEYSNLVEPKDSGVSPPKAAQEQTSVKCVESLGLFSSVMRGAGVVQSGTFLLTSAGNSSSDNLHGASQNTTAKTEQDVASITSSNQIHDTANFSPKNNSSAFCTLDQNTANTDKVHDRQLAAGVLHFKGQISEIDLTKSTDFDSPNSVLLLETMTKCVFLRSISPLVAAKDLISKIYFKKMNKKELSNTDIASKLKKKNSTVSLLCNVLFVEVNLRSGSHILKIQDDDVSSSCEDIVSLSYNKIMSKSAACLLCIFLYMENERRILKQYKSHSSLVPKLTKKVALKCLSKLKACFDLKSVGGHEVSEKSINWLLHDLNDDQTINNNVLRSSRLSTSNEEECGSHSSSYIPGELFVDHDGDGDVIMQVMSRVRVIFPKSSFIRILVVCQKKIKVIDEDMDDHPNTSKNVTLEMKQGMSYLDLVKPSVHPNILLSSASSVNSTSSVAHKSDSFVEVNQDEDVSDNVAVAQSANGNESKIFNERSTDGKASSPFPVPPAISTGIKKKNSLISARVSLNGHRSSMEGRLRSQQQVTSSVSGPIGVSSSTGSSASAKIKRNTLKGRGSNDLFSSSGGARKRLKCNVTKRDDIGGMDFRRSGSVTHGGTLHKKLFCSSSSSSIADKTVDSRVVPLSAANTENYKKRPRPPRNFDSKSESLVRPGEGIVQRTPMVSRKPKLVPKYPTDMVADTPQRHRTIVGTPLCSIIPNGSDAFVANTPM